MALYKYLRQQWDNPNKDVWRERLIEWRQEPATVKIERPTRLDRARALGYKPKQGIILVRQRLERGGRQREKFTGGRRPKARRRRKVLDITYQTVAEQRAVSGYPNCEVLSSYFVAKDGKYYWYEVILVDTAHPVILADKNLSWIAKNHQRGRAFRGLTSSAKKSRGLTRKGFGAEKLRPSRRAVWVRRNK